MIQKINELKQQSNLTEVKSLCETTIAAMSSVIYNNVTPEARFEIERVAIENLFEGLATYDAPEVNQWLNNEKRIYSVKNIGVRKAINILKESDGKFDQTLFSILEQFEEKVNKMPEVLIYEEFVSALSTEYNYVPGVQTQLNAISEKVKKYKNDININKIIETMKVTRSNYLLPLIEDVVNNYVANKTEQAKSHLKETLNKFSYDPFIRDIINLVMLDSKELQLEYANAECDIEKIYSPIIYLGENEVVFNIKEAFYIKKGNNINKLKKDEVSKLDQSFRNLCEAVNVPNVEFSKNEIKVFVDNDVAIINEDTVLVNNKSLNHNEFKDAAEVSQWAGNTNFFMLTETLKNNFNEIVEIDFAKRIYLKEDESYSAHVFKLRNNIFITTFDPINNKSTFYRNINPIQAEKVMSEHMNFDVSKTFSSILPNKERILSQINESKFEYIEYINNLNEKIKTFKLSPKSTVTNEVIAALEEELSEIKSEYKDYVNEIEKYTNLSEGVTVSIDVDGEKYTVPIPQSTSTAKGETADTEVGTVIGAENMEQSPASEITFDDSKTELLGDSPSIESDAIDLGVDNVEAEADAEEAEVGALDGEGEESEESEELGLDDEEGGDEALDDEGEEDKEGTKPAGDEELSLDDEEVEKEEESVNTREYDEDESLNDNDEELDDPLKDETILDIDVPEENTTSSEDPIELEKTSLEEPVEDTTSDKEGGDEESIESGEEVEVEDAEVITAKEAPKVFLRKKPAVIKESIKVKKNFKPLNENAQIGDTVIFDKNKGYVIGQTNDGDLLVQVQGSSHKVDPKKVKSIGKKPEVMEPQYKFDKVTQQNLTTKTLFEQYVKCGIYFDRTPVKINDCYIKFNEWQDAKDDDKLSMIVEGSNMIMPKNQIKILEDINDFGNPDNYIEGVIVDEESGEALENVLINVIDYTQSIGDSDGVRIVKNVNDEQVISYVPAAILKTLSV